jgi:hypothetical protein
MARLTVAFDEAKETVGSYVLDAITPLISSFVDKGIPAIQNLASGLSVTLGPAFTAIFKVVRDDLLPIVLKFWNFLSAEFIPALGAIFGPALKGLANAFTTIKNAVSANSDELAPLLALFKAIWTFTKDNLAPLLGGAFKLALEGIGLIVGGLVTAFSKFVSLLTSIYNGAKRVVDLIKNNPITNLFDDNSKGLRASVSVEPTTGGGGGFDTGGGFNPSSASPTFTGASLGAYSPAMQAAILRREELKAETERLRNAREAAAAARLESTGGKSTAEQITINMGIVGDPEGAARAVVDVLNRSAARGGGGYNALVAV